MIFFLTFRKLSEVKTCFLVEDDHDDQEIFAMALKDVDASINIVTADDGLDAFKKLRDKQIGEVDFIFLDLNMPRMNGKQFLAEIKKDAELKHIPVIIYSTSSDTGDKQEVKRLGAHQFITKPPYLRDLTNILRNFFSR